LAAQRQGHVRLRRAGPLAAGFDVAVIGYTLAPEASLTRMAEEAGRALGWLSDHAGSLGFRRDRIAVGGWSAGGHLAAMLTDHPATHAVLAISGLFDLEPVALLDINETLRITPDEVAGLSPARLSPARSAPLCLAWGGRELPELRRQSPPRAKPRGAPPMAASPPSSAK
jgi:acetyl esterase/lipase